MIMNTETPRTDAITEKYWGNGFAALHLKPEMQAIERELTTVTEQRDSYKDRFESLSKRYAIETQQLTEQRDRLADALERIANNNIQDEPSTDYAYELGCMEGIAKIALQTLT